MRHLALPLALAGMLAATLPAPAQTQAEERDRFTAFLEDNLSGAGRQVSVTGFRGAFSSRAEMDSLTISDDEGVWIRLNDVVLDWNRLAVLRGEISINELSAAEVIVERAPIAAESDLPAAEASGFALPELPVSIDIGKVSVERLTLGEALLGEPVTATMTASARLVGGEGRAALNLLRMDAGKQGQVELNLSYANATGQTVIGLVAEEGPGGIAARLIDLPGAPSVRLVIDGSGPIRDLVTQIELATDGEPRLSGEVAIAAAENGGTDFRADLRGDLAPLFLPEYRDFFGPEIRLSGEGQRGALGQISLRSLSVSARALKLDGAAEIAADGLPQRITLQGRLGLPDGQPVLLPLAGEGETRVAAADIRFSFDASQGDGWSGAAALVDLQRDGLVLGRAGILGSGRINRRPAAQGGDVVGGTLRFDATGVLPAEAGIAAALGRDLSGSATFDWRRGGLGLRIGRLTLDGSDYGLTLSGRIGDLASGFPLSGQVEARYDDLSRLSLLADRPLSGAIRVTAKGDGTALGGDFDGSAELEAMNLGIGVEEVDRLLTGRSTIGISAKRDASGILLRRFDLLARQLTAEVSGRLVSTGNDLKAMLAFSDLGVLGPGYGGSLRANATFTGTPEEGRLTLDGVGQSLRSGIPEADGLLRGESRIAMDVALKEGRFDFDRAQIGNPQITATASGHYDAKGSDIALQVALPDLGAVRRPYRGALEADLRATGTLASGRLELDGRGRNLAIGQPQADRLLAGNSTVVAALNLRDGRLEIEAAQLSNPQLEARATGSVTDSLRRIALEGRLANLALLMPEFPGPVTLSGTVVEDGAGFSVDLAGNGPGGIDARIAGRLASDLASADLAISGTAQAALANPFLGSRAISGQTRFDLRLNGPLALASLSGDARLSGGRLSDPALPFSLEGIEAQARLGGGSVAVDASGGVTTGGRVRVNGSVGMAAPFNASLDIAGEGLRLRDPDLYQTTLDAALRVSGPLTGGGLISGRIDIGETEIRVPDTGFSGGGDLAGLRHVNEPAPVRTTRARAGFPADGAGAREGRRGSGAFALDLLVNAPARIFVRGRGLDAELGGTVTLRGTTADIIPFGQFTLIRGRFDILGKRLELTSARLSMQGDLMPFLEVTASNESDGITTSIVVEGPANAPEVRFTSSPELPQEEVISRLLFGRGLDKISPLQAAQLASAVATLAGRGGEGIIGRLRRGFGLDDLDLQTDAEGNATLTAGKYISENVYTEVEVDQQGRSRINLNLDVKPGVTVRGSVGASGQTGIGIFVEKDY
ncbi:MAG: translocation/assembly module TamB domain-containing protein [Pseudorhodobacter sp.]